jgi:hypothetical protein
MRKAVFVVLPVALLTLAAGAAPSPFSSKRPSLPGTIIDLTHAFDADTIYWPTAGRFELESVAHGVTDKGYFYAANSLCTPEHGGTHMDAPNHFAKDGKTVDQIPVRQLIAPAVVIDRAGKRNQDSLDAHESLLRCRRLRRQTAYVCEPKAKSRNPA